MIIQLYSPYTCSAIISFVSPANMNTELDINWDKSFTKGRAPRIDSQGTPLITFCHPNLLAIKTAHCSLSDSQESFDLI